MKKLEIHLVTPKGYCVYGEITLPEDYTMNMVVNEVRRLGYVKFRLVDRMKRFASVEEGRFFEDEM